MGLLPSPKTVKTPKTVERFFEFSLLGMLASGFGAVVSSGYLEWPYAALTMGALCLRALMVAGIIEIEVSTHLSNAIALIVLGFYPLDYFYISRAFLPSAIHFVFLLTIWKLVAAKSNRDFAYLKTLAILELLAAALLSSNLSFFAFLATFMLSAIASFSSGEVRRSTQQSGQQKRSVVRGGLRAFPRRLGVLSAFLFAGILTMTAALFFVLPRTARAALERFVPQKYHLPGFSNEVTLGQIGEIKQRSTPVLHARRWRDEGSLEVRWRGAVLTQFDGRRWFTLPGVDEEIRVNRGTAQIPAVTHARPGHRLYYQVELSDIAPDILLFAGWPESVNINATYLRLTRGGAIRIPAGSASGLHYNVSSFIEDESSSAFAPPDPLPPAERRELLRLPEVDPRILHLAREMTAAAANDEEKARALESGLRKNYGYTLQLLPSAVPDPLAYFLFERKKGHCEYFASAMAVMLRKLQIPSRVITGFQSGVYNPLTGWQVVRASDAHSWVEAWIPDRGWTTFDPTPADPSAASSGLMSRISLFFDAAEQFWQEWVMSYDLERQIVLASRVEESSRGVKLRWLDTALDGLKETARSSVGYAPFIAVAIGLAIFAVLYGPAIARWWKGLIRLRKMQRGEGDASDATLLYRRMLTLLERRGIQKPPWLTPTEFARVLPDAAWTPLVDDLTSAYVEFRFGGKRDAAPRMVYLLDQLEKM